MSLELLFVEPLDWDHAGLRVVKVGNEEYAVADNADQADKAALECARESLWAFQSTYIGSFLDLSETAIKAIAEMQSKLYEGAQEIIEAMLVGRVDEFLAEAVSVDGRGHFLSHYDGAEQDGEDVSPALKGKLVYRMN
jgi:hypothetical protein